MLSDTDFGASSSEEAAYQRLREHRVWPNVARHLISQKGAPHCLKYVEALSYQRGIEDTGAWLKWAIETDFELDEAVLREMYEAASQDINRPTEQDLQDAGQSSLFTLSAPHGAHQDARVSTDAPELSKPPAPDPQAASAWSSLVQDLIRLRGRDSLPPWFNDFTGGEFVGSLLTVLVPNTTAANHLNDHFGADLIRLWREHCCDERASIEVTLDLQSGKRAALTG